jgi:thiol-disulfide isomerase/thioredoxin
VAEFPQLDELKEKYGKRMNFIAITENTSLNDHLKEFLEKHPFNFYMLQNGEYYKKALKISAIPRNIFIDKDGFIRYIQGNYPYEIDSITGNKNYPKNNYFVKIIDELLK